MPDVDEMKNLAKFADETFGDRPWTSRELFEAIGPEKLPTGVQYALAQGGRRSPVMSLGRLIRMSDRFMRAGRVRTGDTLWMTTAAVYRKWA